MDVECLKIYKQYEVSYNDAVEERLKNLLGIFTNFARKRITICHHYLNHNLEYSTPARI